MRQKHTKNTQKGLALKQTSHNKTSRQSHKKYDKVQEIPNNKQAPNTQQHLTKTKHQAHNGTCLVTDTKRTRTPALCADTKHTIALLLYANTKHTIVLLLCADTKHTIVLLLCANTKHTIVLFLYADTKHPKADPGFFQKREFCFTMDGDIFVRYQSFKVRLQSVIGWRHLHALPVFSGAFSAFQGYIRGP